MASQRVTLVGELVVAELLSKFPHFFNSYIYKALKNEFINHESINKWLGKKTSKRN